MSASTTSDTTCDAICASRTTRVPRRTVWTSSGGLALADWLGSVMAASRTEPLGTIKVGWPSKPTRQIRGIMGSLTEPETEELRPYRFLPALGCELRIRGNCRAGVWRVGRPGCGWVCG